MSAGFWRWLPLHLAASLIAWWLVWLLVTWAGTALGRYW
jgi:hypothetical protein